MESQSSKRGTGTEEEVLASSTIGLFRGRTSKTFTIMSTTLVTPPEVGTSQQEISPERPEEGPSAFWPPRGRSPSRTLGVQSPQPVRLPVKPLGTYEGIFSPFPSQPPRKSQVPERQSTSLPSPRRTTPPRRPLSSPPEPPPQRPPPSPSPSNPHGRHSSMSPHPRGDAKEKGRRPDNFMKQQDYERFILQLFIFLEQNQRVYGYRNSRRELEAR